MLQQKGKIFFFFCILLISGITALDSYEREDSDVFDIDDFDSYFIPSQFDAETQTDPVPSLSNDNVLIVFDLEGEMVASGQLQVCMKFSQFFEW